MDFKYIKTELIPPQIVLLLKDICRKDLVSNKCLKFLHIRLLALIIQCHKTKGGKVVTDLEKCNL